ncbi:MAG: hypothetical protein WAT81_00125 [Candidatus Moraniibacteriota bacterium]
MEKIPTETETTSPVDKNVAPKLRPPKLHFSNRTLVIAFFSLLVLGSAYGYRNFFIAATIDGRPVSRLALIRQLEKTGGKAALDAIITERIIAQEAAKDGIVISPADIDTEIETIRGEIAAQGMTLESALAAQNLTIDDARKQIAVRKELEKLLGDTIAVTDADIDIYLQETGLSTPANMSEEAFRTTIREQLANQKFGKAADTWITNVRAKAHIRYFGAYEETTDTPSTPTATTPAP